MAQTFTRKNPEAGWPPFIDWLHAQGLVAGDVVSIAVHDDGSAVATVFDSPRRIVDREMATHHQRIDQVTGPPPLHPVRGVT